MLHYSTVDARSLGLLKRLMASRALDGFYLTGGTGLSLQIGHRISCDLDLFTERTFDTRELAETLLEEFQFEIAGQSRNTLNLIVEGIKVDLIRYRYPLLRDLRVEDGIRMAHVDDIACMKLWALTGRGAKKDFYDLYFILRDCTLPDLMTLFRKKYPAQETFHVLKSLVYFDDAEGEPEPVLLKEIGWDAVKNTLVSAVRSP